MIGEVQSVWKALVVAYFKLLYLYSSEWTEDRDTTLRQVDRPAGNALALLHCG
jgi:hypothetical protein